MSTYQRRGAHATLEGEAGSTPLHCVRGGKEWRMKLENPSELANDIEVKLAELRGRYVVQQELRNGLRHSIQLHTPTDSACWVC